MKAAVLVKNGAASTAFQIREVKVPTVKKGEVLINVTAFGLNFADVMARRGSYKEAPPIPSILGYDVAGIIEQTGEGVAGFKIGDRVAAMTRFGGYAQYAIANEAAVICLPQQLDDVTATALTTQYCTAVYAAGEMINLHEGDKVLIHAGAGGVGTALIQYAQYKKCEIFSTAGSDAKLNYLQNLGVQHTINYKTNDFEKIIKDYTGKSGIDIIFDAVGGKTVKKGMRLLGAGGRMVCYGAAAITNENIIGKISTALAFGFYHPVQLMMPSKAIIGINMLQIGDNHPAVIARCLAEVLRLNNDKIFIPTIGKVFNAEDIGQAHQYLEERKSIGKIVIKW